MATYQGIFIDLRRLRAETGRPVSVFTRTASVLYNGETQVGILKTDQPLILTARIAERDLEPFDLLRRVHFPPDRNFLKAHLTMFHRLPGKYVKGIAEILADVASRQDSITAKVSGLRHLGMGVAFVVDSSELQAVHAELRKLFMPWLGGQDMRRWQPHITVQNKVVRSTADNLHRTLLEDFSPHPIDIVGLDLWKYLNGPWQHESCVLFGQAT